MISHDKTFGNIKVGRVWALDLKAEAETDLEGGCGGGGETAGSRGEGQQGAMAA